MHGVLPRKVNNGSVAAPRLLDYYEQNILPVLFERLDRAFPELHWSRTRDGWTGQRHGRGNVTEIDFGTVRCTQPWGFTDSSGRPVSWLAYVNGGRLPRHGKLIETVRGLARRAGVDESALNSRFSAEDEREIHWYERQRELLEAFVAYCHVRLVGDAGHQALSYLRRAHGINGHDASELPLGVYSSREDVFDYLAGVGFSEDEINASRVVRDVRLTGRVVIPWRDRWGNIRTVVAHETTDELNGLPRQLYRKTDATDDAFGLDVALRPSSGGLDHLILVEGLLDVVFFQTQGLTNVAAFGGTGKVPTTAQWEKLARHGIRHVTLAFTDDDAGWERTLLALDNAYRAQHAPQVFALARRSLGTARGAATSARLRGMGKLREVISARLHGFHYVANALIEQHKDGAEWTDAGLVEILNDAIDFDTRVYTTQRVWELDRFFWPPILKSMGADWEAVRKLLKRPLDAPATVVKTPIIQPKPQPAPRTVAPPLPPVSPPRTVAPPLPPVSPPRVEVRREPRVTLPPLRTLSPRRTQPTVDSAPEPAPLPIDLHELAYAIWERKGRPTGEDQQIWLEAEKIVRQRQAQGERIYAKTA